MRALPVEEGFSQQEVWNLGAYKARAVAVKLGALAVECSFACWECGALMVNSDGKAFVKLAADTETMRCPNPSCSRPRLCCPSTAYTVVHDDAKGSIEPRFDNWLQNAWCIGNKYANDQAIQACRRPEDFLVY